MTTFTLADFALLDTNELRAGIIMTLLRYSSIMDRLRWETIGSLKVEGTRWNTLPTTGFRKLGGSYTHNEGTYDQVWESVYAFGGSIQMERAYTVARNVLRNPMVDQTEMKLKSLACTFNDYFINGDHGTDPDGFEGLKKRISAMPSRQTVYPVTSSSDALDVTASVANAITMLKALDKAFMYCNAGNVAAIFCNENWLWGFPHALKYAQANGGSLLDYTKDNFDRTVMTYKGVPFIDVGLKYDQTTEIITDTELDPDSTHSVSTSLYFVSYDPIEGVGGIQLEAMQVLDDPSVGPLQQAKVIDWFPGLASWGKYGMVRVKGIEGASNWTA